MPNCSASLCSRHPPIGIADDRRMKPLRALLAALGLFAGTAALDAIVDDPTAAFVARRLESCRLDEAGAARSCTWRPGWP
jgi:hypothetical protein